MGRVEASFMNELERLRGRERWIARVRLLGVPFAVVEVGIVSTGYPPGYELRASIITALLPVGAVAVWHLARQELDLRAQRSCSASPRSPSTPA
jgi:hypothetical protein